MRIDRYTKAALTVIALCLCALSGFRFHWFQAAAEANAGAELHPMSYVDFLTVVLTALGVMLTGLAIIIAIAAIWGYGGIKESLTKEVRENADMALKEKLREYPAAQEMVDLKRRLEQIEQLRAQMMTAQAPETTATVQASGNVENWDEGEVASFPAQDYPPQIGT